MGFKVKVLSVLAVCMMCLTAVVISGDSEAYDINEGSNALTVKTNELNGDDVSIFYDYSNEDPLLDAIRNFVDNEDLFTFPADKVSVKNYVVEQSVGKKVTDNSKEELRLHSEKYTLEFTAVCDESGYTLFRNDSAIYSHVMKELGCNTTESGSYFTVTADYEYVISNIEKVKFVKNDNEIFPATSYEKTYYELESWNMDVTYHHIKGDSEKVVEFSSEFEQEYYENERTNYDYGSVEPENADNQTKVFMDTKWDCRYRIADVCRYDGEKYGEYESCEYDEPVFSGSQGGISDVATTSVKCTDLDPITIAYYGDSEHYSLFYPYYYISPEYRDNNKLKDFLEKNGDVSDSYSKSYDAVSGSIDDLRDDERQRKIFFIAMGIVLGAMVIVLGGLLVLRSRRVNQA